MENLRVLLKYRSTELSCWATIADSLVLTLRLIEPAVESTYKSPVPLSLMYEFEESWYIWRSPVSPSAPPNSKISLSSRCTSFLNVDNPVTLRSWLTVTLVAASPSQEALLKVEKPLTIILPASTSSLNQASKA